MHKIYYGNPSTDGLGIAFWQCLSVLTLPTNQQIHFIFGRYVTDTPEKIERLLDEFFSIFLYSKESWDDELYPYETNPITDKLCRLLERDSKLYYDSGKKPPVVIVTI